MSAQIEILILTKSAKHKAFCVAGLNLKTGDFIRLVKDEDGGALTNSEINNAEIFDVVKCEAIPAPIRNQTENYILRSKPMFLRKGSLGELCDLYNDEKFSHIGAFGNNYNALNSVLNLNYSLSIIFCKDIKIFVNDYNSVKVDFFDLNSQKHSAYSMTDPDYYNKNYPIEIKHALLILSLPNDPYEKNGKYYKFVAKIFEVSKKSE